MTIDDANAIVIVHILYGRRMWPYANVVGSLTGRRSGERIEGNIQNERTDAEIVETGILGFL